MSDTKIEFKAFFLPDYEKEEQYLSEMHRNGWRLKKIIPYVYFFEKCEPENAVYRLDFKNTDGDEASYIKMYEDYGWEYMQKLNSFMYFRKSTEESADDELEIFSDNESRLEMVQRVIKTKLLPVWIVFTVLFLPLFIVNIGYAFTNRIVFSSAFYKVIFALAIALFVIDTYIVIHCFRGLMRLKKKYSGK